MSVISTGSISGYKRGGRWKTFVAGLAIDAAGLYLLVAIAPRLTTDISIEPLPAKHYVALVAPIIAPPAIQAPPTVLSPPEVAALEKPKVVSPPIQKVTPPKISKPQLAKVTPPEPPEPPKILASTSLPPLVKPAPPAEIKTDVFGAKGSKTATVHAPPRQVQTGGFGDPNGVPPSRDQNRGAVAIASVGSFELPSGAGKGNGTGGTHGVAGTIKSAGFTDGVSSATQSRHGSGEILMASGFGDRVAQAGAAPLSLPAKPQLEPVEIVFKPRPDYTQEAIRQRVEGEVLLDVIFKATGALQVNRVVKGLGYGLDDTAMAAAQRIRFRPARKDGQPYDCAALVHMVFELTK